MNPPSHEEFEEVESPFNPRPKPSRLRSKKSSFNRTFAADPSIAPAIFDEPKRKRISHRDHIELNDFRKNKISEAEINYLENDEITEDFEPDESSEEKVKTTKRASPISKKKNISVLSTFARVAWVVIGVLTLRLIFMDRGVWDYFNTEKNLKNKSYELKSVQKENRELLVEINKIKYDKGYQKQLAKEHLGVIAADEFLVLFAGESLEGSTSISEKNI